MIEKNQKIISRIILSTSIVLIGISLIPAFGKDKKKEEKNIPVEDEFIEENVIEEDNLEIKDHYTLEEFDDLIVSGEAEIIKCGAGESYYRNTHTTSNKNYLELSGSELWQRYVLVDNELVAIEDYMYVSKNIENRKLNR